MPAHYRHTQIGWATLGGLAVVAFPLVPTLPAEAGGEVRVPVLLLLGLVLLLFGTLTVEVDEQAVRLRFGLGLVRRRIGLAEVRAWQPVRNPWYYGWGIHSVPRGMLWNVSGFDAVEIALPGGRRLRVGTDEPEALVSAIAQAKGFASPAPPGDEEPAVPRRGLARGVVLALVAGVALVAGIFWSQIQPLGVKVSARGFEVLTLFYGQSFAAEDITAISLETRLPRVLARTNGFAGAGTLRGHFRVEGLGPGRLYVDVGFAPYVLVRLREGFVIVNDRDPERTRVFYEEMARAWPDRVVAAAP